MREIRLREGVWMLDDTKPLGPPGGFGQVFLGIGTDGKPVAVKLLRLRPKVETQRELKIADFLLGHDYPHVIPILDVGTDVVSGEDVIVMARADKSLEDLIRQDAPIAERDVLEILNAIAAGLYEIDVLVHRDLKPANVLLHNGVWKLADLGLARFVEASTSVNTMKDFLTAAYAAPELWRSEHATKATDVYSCGCMLYALLTGRPPFPGPTMADYGQQHQTGTPPGLPASAALRNLASACLAKSQAMRPSIESVLAQIRRARDRGEGAQALAHAGRSLASTAAVLAEAALQEEAERALTRSVAEDRKALSKEATARIREMMHELVERVLSEAPNAIQEGPDRGGETVTDVVRLGKGFLTCSIPFPIVEASLGKLIGTDVVVGAAVEVSAGWTSVPGGTPSRSANLWFAKLGLDDGYRWWEASYMYTPKAAGLRGGTFELWAPFSLGKGHSWAGYRPGLDNAWHWSWYALTANPRPIDGECLEEFYSRWMGWLAKMALGQYSAPTQLPEEDIDPRFVRSS